MLRALVFLLLVLGVAGFGLCALCSGAFALSERSLRGLLVLSLVTGAAAGLCFWGVRVMWRKDRALAAARRAAAELPQPPGPPASPPAPPPA